MNWWTAAPTMGSFVVGAYIAILAILDWWPGLPGGKGKFDAKGAVLSALPLLAAYAYGVLVILGVGGLIGWAANFTLWGVGWVGDGALIWGVGGSRQNIAHGGQRMALTNGGLMVVLLCTAVVIGVRKRKKTTADTRKAVGRGVLAGILTGTVAGVSAALAVPLASAVNAIGGFLPGAGS